MSTKKVIEYLEKHKNEMDKTYISILCELLIYTDFNYNVLKHLLKGAHFIIRDNGCFYKKWKKYSKENKSMFKHLSSHSSCKKVYRIGKNKICNINGHINHNYDCLVGKICYSDKLNLKNNINHDDCDTWFQFEKTRLNNIVNKLKHSVDFVHHLFSKKNIGPFGKSNNTQNNPIFLKFKNSKI